jgi:hypothetical protein
MRNIKTPNRILYVSLLFTLPVMIFAQKEVFVDLTIQKAYAIEDGKKIFEGRISSGKSGHETPTGNFTILQKKRIHKSNLYPEPNGGAKMPYMMRLTWDGVAMHQGYVPKRPASHGCIRLRRRFARKLFRWIDKGTPVTVGGDISRYYNTGDGYSYGVYNSYKKDRDGYSIIEVY